MMALTVNLVVFCAVLIIFTTQTTVVLGINFRKERYIASIQDYCLSASSCHEYSFNDTEYSDYALILEEELQTNVLLRSGWQKAKTLHKSHPLLSENETLAVVTYTLDYPKVYDQFNFLTRTRGISSHTFPYKGMHFFLSSAVHKLAVTRPQSTIRCEPAPKSLTVGSKFSFKQFASTTMDYYTALQFGDFCFNIMTLRGASISALSAFPFEKEILIPSCETFQVIPLEPGYRFYANLGSTDGMQMLGNATSNGAFG